ncbi:MAG: site-specific DNA-methyltransferase [Anaerolineae bacterium]
MSNIVIQTGDSLELMRDIDSASIDLVIADPPYNLGKNYGNNHDIRGFREYLQFSETWLQEAHRVLAPRGTLYVFMGFRFISYLYDILDQRLGMYFNSWITWHYTQGMGRTKGFSPRHDDILMFTKSEDYVFNIDSVRIPQKYYRERNNMAGANPGDVWAFSHVHYSNPEREDHPTQKPEALIARMILASSNEGDLVLDPFSGSGTTARVCQVLNRRCLAMEINPDYVERTRKRLALHFEGFDSADPRLDRTPRDLPQDEGSINVPSKQMFLLEGKSEFASPTIASTRTRNPRRVSRR